MLDMMAERMIPKLLSQEQMLSLMFENVYGFLPPKPTDIHFEICRNIIPFFCAGKATCDKVTAICSMGEKSFSFPFHVTIPSDDK